VVIAELEAEARKSTCLVLFAHLLIQLRSHVPVAVAVAVDVVVSHIV
jgi:hypothetical protein